LKVDRALFLGNSITMHPPVPDEDWPGDCGMAASAPDKDYVHLLLARFAEAAGGRTPDAIVENIADFERHHDTFDIPTAFTKHIDFRPDVVILAIGENVPSLTTDEAKMTFRDAVVELLIALKSSGSPEIIVRSCFWPAPDRDEMLRRACTKVGGTFVEIGQLGTDKSNFASAERMFKNVDVGNHPGDKGMAAIAETIWSSIGRRL